jgi:hypothetical protein
MSVLPSFFRGTHPRPVGFRVLPSTHQAIRAEAERLGIRGGAVIDRLVAKHLMRVTMPKRWRASDETR